MITRELEIVAGITVAPTFRIRYKDRAAYKAALKDRGEEEPGDWSTHKDGDYGEFGLYLRNYRGEHEFSGKVAWYGRTRKNATDLAGLEKFFRSQAEKLLAAKKGQSPVIMLDIGGYVGQTWSRLALSFEKEVRSSQIIFIVSNLVYNPEQHLKAEFHRDDRYDIKMLTQARSLVHYINGDASDLRRMQIDVIKTARLPLIDRVIQLPGQRELPLKGNVDFMHERFSLTYWSYVPELEILQAASLLSNRGMYFIECGDHLTGGLEYFHYEEGESRLGSWHRRGVARDNGIYLAFEEMQRRYGMVRVTHVEAGELLGEEIGVSPGIFKKSNAPLIEVNRIGAIPVSSK